MAFVVELKNAKGHTIYDTSLRNFSLISRQRVTVPPPQNGGVEITIPNPETTIPFVRIEGNYESNVCLIGGVEGNKLGLTLAPPASGSAAVTSKIAIIYFMGVGTTGIVPEYGAVIRSASGAVEWSSMDNPLFIRTMALNDAHATPNASLIGGSPIAVCPAITGTIERAGGGVAFVAVTGFANGLRSQAFGNFSGSGAWHWSTMVSPKLDYQVYIETNYMD